MKLHPTSKIQGTLRKMAAAQRRRCRRHDDAAGQRGDVRDEPAGVRSRTRDSRSGRRQGLSLGGGDSRADPANAPTKPRTSCPRTRSLYGMHSRITMHRTQPNPGRRRESGGCGFGFVRGGRRSFRRRMTPRKTPSFPGTGDLEFVP